MTEFEANMERLFRLMFEKTAAAIVSGATVKSVDKTKDICVLSRDGDSDLINVRLKATIDNGTNKIVSYPKLGSQVLYVLIENKITEAFVFAMSEVDEVSIIIGKTKMLLNANETVFNDGLNGGLIKIDELTKKVNELVKSLNDFVASYNKHTHTVTTTGTAAAQSGTAAKIVTGAQEAKQINKSDFENEKIKH